MYFNKFLVFIFAGFFIISLSLKAQESQKKSENSAFVGKIGVVDMQKILNDSKAYQGIVEQFENIRRSHRNKITKIEDQIRDDENNLFKQKNIISKEAYSAKVQEISKKINELKLQKNKDAKKFELAFERSTNKIQKALVDVLSIIAKKKELSVVMAKSQVLLVGKDIDLTDEASTELNNILPKVKLELN